MAKRKVTTSYIDVYKVKGETMTIAFNNLKQEKGWDNHHLEVEKHIDLNKQNISNGAIYRNSKALIQKYINGEISEYTIKGALYNTKPNIRDESRLVMHDIVIKGTKQWETVNSFRTDGGHTIHEEVSMKSEAKDLAKKLSLERNETVNVVVSKRLVGTDGVIAISEFIPFDCIDDTNIYVFWVFVTKVEEVDEDELIDENTEVDSLGQLSIKEDLQCYFTRSIVS